MDTAPIAARFKALTAVLDERTRRLLAAAESQAIGWGGISSVSRATGISRPVIRQGIAELKDPTLLVAGRVRRQGGGRKKAVEKDAAIRSDLEALLESTTRGDPEATLDLQKRPAVDGGTEALETSSQSPGCGRLIA